MVALSGELKRTHVAGQSHIVDVEQGLDDRRQFEKVKKRGGKDLANYSPSSGQAIICLSAPPPRNSTWMIIKFLASQLARTAR